MKIIETKDGAIIEVYVKPNSAKFEVLVEDEELVVRCTEEPVKSKVNKELIKELSKFFHSNVEVVSGFTSKQKKFLVKGRGKTEIEQILAAN